VGGKLFHMRAKRHIYREVSGRKESVGGGKGGEAVLSYLMLDDQVRGGMEEIVGGDLN